MVQLREREPVELDLGSERVVVKVRESARARTARIIVGPRRPLEIIVPASIADAAVAELLAEKRGWIRRKLESAREIASHPATLNLAGRVWLHGEPRQAVRRSGSPARAVAGADGALVVTAPNDAAAAQALERWYRRRAGIAVRQIAAHEAARLGLKYRSVAVRDQRTRWGSCSAKGNLSFSWRLILAPPEVLEYVVVHELLHLREPNHSKAFWRLLESTRPGWQEQARWLREHGQELHEYVVPRST